MSLYQYEEKLTRIATEVASAFKNGEQSLNGLVKSAMDKHMLDANEVKTLCGKVNHLVFKDKFAEDKLSVYDIAKYEDILKVDRNMNVVEYKAACYADETFVKAAADDTSSNINDVEMTPGNAALLSGTGEENISDMRQLDAMRDHEMSSIKNRVVALVREGESLDNIYAVLKDTWGANNDVELKAYFANLIDELKKEGYIKNTERFSGSGASVDASDEEPLKQAAMNILGISEQMMIRENVHEYIVNKLAEAGYDIMAENIERKRPHESYSINCAMCKGASVILADHEKVASTQLPVHWQTGLRSALTAGAVIGGGLKALQLGNSAIDAIRKNIWREKLRKKYPELNSIPEGKYNDLYDSIVGLEPELLKAPYALKEMIMAHHMYGTIDSQTILKLLESGRKTHPNTPLIASTMGKAMAMAPEYVLTGN